jgi:methyl-accepting chemotaxis protein
MESSEAQNWLSQGKMWLLIVGGLATPFLMLLTSWFIKNHVQKTDTSIDTLGKKLDAQSLYVKGEFDRHSAESSKLSIQLRTESNSMVQTVLGIKKEVNDELYNIKSTVQEIKGQSDHIKYQAGQVATFMETTAKEVKSHKDTIDVLMADTARHQKALEASKLLMLSFREQIRKLEQQMLDAGMTKEEIEHRLEEMAQTFIKFGRTGTEGNGT